MWCQLGVIIRNLLINIFTIQSIYELEMFSWSYISFNFYNLANGGPKIELDQMETLFVFNKLSFWNDEGEGYLVF